MLSVVKQKLAQYLDIKEDGITEDTDIRKDLKADSLILVEMLFELEEEMGIVIPDDKVEALSRVGDLVKFLESVKK